MLLQLPPKQPSIASRFQRAMLVSWLMKWWTHIRGYSLTFLEVKTSAHWERPYIVSSYGERIASSFEGHQHRVSRLLLEVRHRVSRLPLLQVHERVSRLLLEVRHLLQVPERVS